MPPDTDANHQITPADANHLATFLARNSSPVPVSADRPPPNGRLLDVNDHWKVDQADWDFVIRSLNARSTGSDGGNGNQGDFEAALTLGGCGAGINYGNVGTLHEMQEWVWNAIPASTCWYAYRIEWGDGASDWYFEGDTPRHTYVDDDPPGTSSDTYPVTITSYAWDENNTVGTAEINVTNVLPVANDDIVSTNEDVEQLSIDVLSNDTDVSLSDRNSLEVVSFDASGVLGSVTYVGGGIFQYSPNGALDFLAESEIDVQTFSYLIRDDDSLDSFVQGLVWIDVHGRRESYRTVLTALSDTAEENESPGEFTISLETPAKAGGVDVTWALVDPQSVLAVTDPNAAQANDVYVSTGTVHFNEGEVGPKVVQLKAKEDGSVEPDEHAYIYVPSVVNDDYRVDAGNFAVVNILDNEWRWVTASSAWATDFGTIFMDDFLPPADEWKPSWSFDLYENYLVIDVKSIYLEQPGPVWAAHKDGFIEYRLDAVTGVISASANTRISGVDQHGPAVVYLNIRDERFNNEGTLEHSVEFKIDVGSGAEGTFQMEAGVGLTFTKIKDYGQGRSEMRQFVMIARKGNS